MIRYELLKNLLYNKIWVLILIVFIGNIFVSLLPNQQLNSLDIENYHFYYERLNGKIDQSKIDFIDTEMQNINEYNEKSDLLHKAYKEGEISDEEYIKQLEEINSYHYRAITFEDIYDYVTYLQEDNGRDYINENNINRYLNYNIPYLMIIMIIINVIISFQNEQDMYLISKITIRGKKELIRTKILALILINSLVFILLYFLDFLLYLSEIIYVFLTIFLYLLKCPYSLILSALRAFCFCGKTHISRSIFLYFPCQSWLKSW